uniref:Uncharacterized protein n=1 Tax=Solanum tuberosum TaxID=4113 RepID=M1A144_SOLTU
MADSNRTKEVPRNDQFFSDFPSFDLCITQGQVGNVGLTARMAEENRSKHLHDSIRMQNLPQLQNINIIKGKDTNNEKKKETIGSSSTSSEVQKVDEDQMVDEQLHEEKIALCASEHINPFGKIPQGRVSKMAIVVAVWLTASTNAQLVDRYYVIKESGSARYGYETGYARIGPHLDLHMDNLLYYPKESYSYPGHFVLERASSV